MRNLRFRIVLAALVLVAAAALAPGATAGGRDGGTKDNGARYYLSLGDSLAAGFQPGSPFTNEGYADQLYAALAAKHKHLRLVKLGCPGESAATMVSGTGSPCLAGYLHGSQLADAVAFLQAHRHHVRLVTIDIGANDVLGCAPAFTQTCVAAGLGSIGSSLPVILAALRAAGGKHLRIVGMNYYDPFLALWFTNPTAAATINQLLVGQFNLLLDATYAAAGARVADVETAFSTTDFAPVNGVPLNVTRICQWTYMCTVQDIHANTTGYGVIAGAFEAVLE